MKKVLVGLLVLGLVGGLGAFGWLLAKQLGQPAGPAPAQGSSAPAQQEEEKQPDPKLGVIKRPETTADVMEAIAYEQTQNPDAVAWLNVPGTDISNVVVQSFNNVYYLRLTERKKEDIYGCYFADFGCSFGPRDVLSPNTIIYGHSDLKDNPDGPKFSQLFRFTEEAFAREHPLIRFSTIEDDMRWKIFAVFYTDTQMDYINPTPAGGVEALAAEAKSKSLFNYEVPVTAEDKILTLSTCTVKYGTRNDQRFVVMAKLMPKDYQEEKTVELTVNPSPVQPPFAAGAQQQ